MCPHVDPGAEPLRGFMYDALIAALRGRFSPAGIAALEAEGAALTPDQAFDEALALELQTVEVTV